MSQEPAFQPVDWNDVERVLVIMAHPDDPDFTCGGTAIQMARQGIDVTYMILTNGDKGNHNPDITRNQLIALRKIEQRAAADLCGVRHVLFMGEEDGFLQPTRELRYRVTREIRRIRPQIIICNDPDRYFVSDYYINHPDHRNAGLVAIESIFPAADNLMFFPELIDEGYAPHKIRQLYIYGHSTPNARIDFTDDLQLKIDAILCHKTQITEPEKSVPIWKERWKSVEDDGATRYYEQFRVMKFT